jgi:hypothetical protein
MMEQWMKKIATVRSVDEEEASLLKAEAWTEKIRYCLVCLEKCLFWFV